MYSNMTTVRHAAASFQKREFRRVFMHKAPTPEPVDEPLPGDHPVPQEDPVPSPNPEACN